VLDGGAGSDNMQGGVGNDRYYVDSWTDVVEELAGAGIDEVRTIMSTYTLGANVENLQALNYTAFSGVGNALNNVIESDDGNDWLWGQGGNDTLYGGAGNDSLYGGTEDDVLQGGYGGDYMDGGTGNNAVSYAKETQGVSINLAFNSAFGGTATGDILVNIANVLGSEGADVLTGNAAANVLNGNGGIDVLNGGLGNDILTGGAGADVFVFTSGLAAGGRDLVTDFDILQDIVRLSVANLNVTTTDVVGGAELAIQLASGTHTVAFTGVSAADLSDHFQFV
jgi:serralysin